MEPFTYAQMDDLVLVKVRKEGIIPFGSLVDIEIQRVLNDDLNLFSVLKNGDWEVPNLSKEEDDKIIRLVKNHLGIMEK